MPEYNPYAAPSSNLGGQDSYGENEGGVTRGVVSELTRTKGWTRFIGVLAVIGAIGILIFGLSVSNDLSGLSRAVGLRGTLFGMGAGFMLVVVLMAILFLIYGVMLNGFSSSINRLIQHGTERELFEALRRQRNFWIFWGLLTIVSTILTLIGLLS